MLSEQNYKKWLLTSLMFLRREHTAVETCSRNNYLKQLQAGYGYLTHVLIITVVSLVSFLGLSQQAQAHTTITKTTSTPTVAPGGTATYTINVTDAGTSSATTGITITDALPTGFTYLSTQSVNTTVGATRPTTVNPTVGSNTPSWGTFSTPVAGTPASTFNITFSALVPIGGTCGKYDNAVTAAPAASMHTYVPYTGTASTAEDVTVTGSLSASKTTSTPTVVNTPTGTQATYTIVLSNTGQCTIPSVSISDALPTGLTYLSTGAVGFTGGATRPTATNPAAGATAPVWSNFTLPSGGTVSLTFTANIASSVLNGTYNNDTSATTTTAGITVTPYVGTSSTLEDVTVKSADLTVTKTHIGNFTQGQTGDYTLTATNSGTIATSGTVSVVDTLPTGLTATAISGTGWTCTLGTLTCTRSDALAVGSSYPVITLTVNVATNAAASVTNNATVSGGGETNTANDTATNLTTVNGISDLTITKTHVGNFTQGQTGATYTLTATNSGTLATSGTVSIVDTLPTGLTATAISGTGWTCTLGTLTCTRTNALAVGSSYPVITLTVNVATNAAASVTNNATVSGGGEIYTANDTATDSTTITTNLADLRLSKTANPASPSVGGTFNYTITVTNDGPSTATNVQVIDRLPPVADVLVNSLLITTSQGSAVYNVATPNIVWTVGTLAPNTSATLTIPATRLLASFTVNVAEVTASDQSDPDSTPGNNIASEDDQASVTVPSQSVDLAVTKSVSNPSPTVGQNVTFTITVTNPSSTVTATGVGISDLLPTGLTYQSNTLSQGSYTPGTGVWSVGSLSPTTTATLTITATVNASGMITNTAQLIALDQTDPNPTNNSSSATVTPASFTPNLRLVKRITAINGSSINTVIDPTTTLDPNDNAPNWPAGYLKGAVNGGLVKPNDQVEYTIYFLSDGDSPVRRVQVCDLVPTNNTFIATTFDGLTPTDGGLPQADAGIALSIGSTAPTVYLTNVGGDGLDRGQFLAPNAAVPASCGTGSNTDGAIVVNVVTDTSTPSNLPNATAPTVPTSSYGFIRFRAKVN